MQAQQLPPSQEFFRWIGPSRTEALYVQGNLYMASVGRISALSAVFQLPIAVTASSEPALASIASIYNKDRLHARAGIRNKGGFDTSPWL
jgi:hypothetical protein